MVQRWRCNGWLRNAMAEFGEAHRGFERNAAVRRFIGLSGGAMVRHCRALFGNAMARRGRVSRCSAKAKYGNVKFWGAAAKLRVAMMVTLR